MILPWVVSQTWIEGLRRRDMFDKSKRQAAPFKIIPTHTYHTSNTGFLSVNVKLTTARPQDTRFLVPKKRYISKPCA